MVNYVKSSYHTVGYDKDISRTGVRLEFPHPVKFQTDSCLECRGMRTSFESTQNGQLPNLVAVLDSASVDRLGQFMS